MHNCAHKLRLHIRVEEEDVRELNLNEALNLYGKGALEHRYCNDTHGKQYLNKLYRLSNELGDIPLRKISGRDIRKLCASIAPSTALNYLNCLNDFINYLEIEKHTSTGLILIITDAIKTQRRAKNKGSGRGYEKKSMTDVLPNAIEQKINRNYSAPQSQHTFPSSARRIASKGFTPCFLAVLI